MVSASLHYGFKMTVIVFLFVHIFTYTEEEVRTDRILIKQTLTVMEIGQDLQRYSQSNFLFLCVLL